MQAQALFITRMENNKHKSENVFEGSELEDPLSCAAKELFGLPYLFPYQRLVITNIMEAVEAAHIRIRWRKDDFDFDSDVVSDLDESTESDDRESSGRQIVILPTGAGKSLCFQLPAMLINAPTLVIYPILGLMADQERRLTEQGFSPVTLRGGQNREERNAIWERLKTGESKFVIANPEVLLTEAVMARLKDLHIAHIVIDEAHCVSEWGQTFRPSYLEIGKIIEAAGAPVITAFTATAGASVLEKIQAYIFGEKGARRIVGNPDRKNISYSAKGCIVRNAAVRDLITANLRPAIVFCSSRKGTEYLAKTLRSQMADLKMPWHREIRFYHAGLSGEEKKKIENWFLHSDSAVLVATCAYGLGIDKPDIRTVIHRDCPPSVEAYLQESGRAGRDGLPSTAVLLWGPEDERSLQRAKTESEKNRILRLLAYAKNLSTCRRQALQALLDYEGEGDSPGTRCCDVCENEAKGDLREVLSVSDFFRRNKCRYTAAEAGSVLTKAQNIRLSEEEIAEVINHLIKSGRLKRLKNPLWKNKLILCRRV